MKKSKILLSVLSLVLLVGVIFGVMSMTASAARGTGGTINTSTDWKENGLGLVKGEDYAYSFAVVGDTQNLNYYDVNNNTTHMNTLYQWLVDNKDAKNIQYVMGVGDITQSWHTGYAQITPEWKHAAGAVAILDGVIPYSLVRGNHDLSSAAKGFFNGVFGIGDNLGTDKNGNDVDNQYYEDLVKLSEQKDSQGRPMAGIRVDGRIEDTYRKVTMGDHNYIIFTLDWHPMSKATDCVTDTKDLCVNVDYCTVHNDPADCAANSAKCVIKNGCKNHDSVANGSVYCNTELCADNCEKHDALGWLDRLLTENSDYTAIITLHSFIMRDGSLVDDNEDVFPYENVNNASRPKWHEVSVTGGNVTQKQLWDEVLSNHANVKMLFCGHVDEDNIITTQLRGKNGNTVTCALIDGQTIDSKQERAGLVAMYYISADGKIANVEYISTVRAAAGLPAYLRDENQFKHTIDYGDAWTQTPYGEIPTEIYNSYPFHVMLDDDSDTNTVNNLYGSYNTWEETLSRVNELNAVGYLAARQAKTYNIVLSKDYTYTNELTSSQLDHNQACNNPSKIVLDLNGNTFTLASGTTFLPMYNAKNSFHPSFTVKNGNMIFNGTANGIVTQHGHPVNASGSVVDINLTDLNVTYASGATGYFIHNFKMSSKSDTRSSVNLNVTNCNIDASQAGAFTLFNMKDGYNDSDVNLKITGGSFKGGEVAKATLFTQNWPGDKITFLKDSEGNYTTFTFADSTQLAGAFYSATEGETLEFGASAEKDGAYVSTLVTSAAVLTKYGAIPFTYANTTNYPFVIFKNGEMVHASANWNTLINSTIKGNKDYQSGCTVLLRRDYNTTDAGYSPSWFAYIDDLTIDLGENVFTRGSYHMFQLFGTESTAHTTNITVTNGTLKNASAMALIAYNNNSNNSAADNLNMTFNGVKFDISGITGKEGIIATYGDGTAKGVNSNIVLNDCTIYRGASTKTVTLFIMIDNKSGMANNKTDVKVTINGGKLVADTMSGLTIATYSPERIEGEGSPDTITLGKGSDGRAFEIVLPSSQTAPKTAYTLTAGAHYLGKLQDNTDGTTSYTLGYADTVYGAVSYDYASVKNYPFALFYNGAFKKGYATLAQALSAAVELTNTQEEIDVCDTVHIAMRRDFVSATGTNFVRSRGKIVVDLQGYQLSSSAAYLTDGFINYSKITADNVKEHLEAPSEITFKNGTVKNDRADYSLFNIGASNGTVLPDEFSSYSRKHFIYNFEGITFKTGKSPIMHAWNHTGLGFDIDVNINGCTFDFTGATAGVSMFSCADNNNIYAFNLAINGCEVIATKLDSYKLYSLGANDTAKLGLGDKTNYLTVTQTTDSVPANIYTAADGKNIAFFPGAIVDGKYVYVLVSDDGIETEYGKIPADKADEKAYPLVLFEGNKETGYTIVDYYSDFALALTKISGALGKDYVILVRSDYTKTTKKYIGNFTGSLTLDLGGNTFSITEAGNYLLDLGVGVATGPSGTFNVKNGTVIKEGGRGVVCMNYDSNLKTKDAAYTFNFDGVTFVSKDSTYNKNVVFTTWEGAYDNATAKIVINSTFENCTFDYRSSINGVVMLPLNHSSGTKDRVEHHVTVNGGTILAKTAADINNNFALLDGNTNGRADSIQFGGNSVKLVLPTSVDAAAVTSKWKSADGVECVFVKTASNDNGNVYELAVKTGYGNISLNYASKDKYPFVIFKMDKTFVGGYTSISAAITASGLVSGGTGSKVGGADCVILLRKNAAIANTGNVTGYKNNVIIDLNGYTLTSTSACLMTLTNSATTSTDKTYGTVTFKNGAICYTGGGTASSIVRANGAEGVYTINFENVRISTTNTAQTSKLYLVISTSGTSKAAQTVNSTFTDCVFDYTKAQAICYMFGSGGGAAINATLVGCEIIAGDNNALAYIDTANNKQALAYYPGTTNDTLKIVNNIKLTLDDGVAAPAASNVWKTAEGIECVFVKSAENDGYVNYSLYPKAMVGYKIKTSVTLWSNFVYNIYIPKTNANSFTINEATMEYEEIEIDGVAYYHVAVNLPAGETLQDIKVSVKLNSGATTVDANWTLNVLNYTKSVINGSYDDTTKTLMKDMLVYANAAYTYFGNTLEAEKSTTVATLLEGYTKVMPTGEAKKPTDKTYFTDVAVYLGEVPSFRFTLADGYTADNFTFKVGNRNATVIAGDGYVEIVMYAYMMLDDVTFTVKGTDVTESYNLYAYYEYAKTLNNANLTAIVEGLMKYSVSAADYRNTVIGSNK